MSAKGQVELGARERAFSPGNVLGSGGLVLLPLVVGLGWLRGMGGVPVLQAPRVSAVNQSPRRDRITHV